MPSEKSTKLFDYVLMTLFSHASYIELETVFKPHKRCVILITFVGKDF